MKYVVEWPAPQTVHDIRSFLGLTSYYRRFIWGFSQIVRPLTDLTEAKVQRTWGNKDETSFERLKGAQASAPPMRFSDFERQFVVTTDASDVAGGTILKQNFGRGLQPVTFASRNLNNAEYHYSAYEQEPLGIIWGWNNGDIIFRVPIQ